MAKEVKLALEALEKCVKSGDTETAHAIAQIMTHFEPADIEKVLNPIDPEIQAAILKHLESLRVEDTSPAAALQCCKLAKLNMEETKPFLKRFILHYIEKGNIEYLMNYMQYL